MRAGAGSGAGHDGVPGAHPHQPLAAGPLPRLLQALLQRRLTRVSRVQRLKVRGDTCHVYRTQYCTAGAAARPASTARRPGGISLREGWTRGHVTRGEHLYCLMIDMLLSLLHTVPCPRVHPLLRLTSTRCPRAARTSTTCWRRSARARTGWSTGAPATSSTLS